MMATLKDELITEGYLEEKEYWWKAYNDERGRSSYYWWRIENLPRDEKGRFISLPKK